MKPELQSKLELFVNNVNGMKKSLPWQEPMAKRLVALVYALDGLEVDNDAIVQSHRLIKEETRVFSAFRGNLSVLIAAMLAKSDDPQQRFRDTVEVHDMLRKKKFRHSDFLVAAAYEIASQAKREDFPQVVERARAFFQGMRANHRFLVDADDYIFSAMLALSDMDVEGGCEKVNNLYTQLRGDFPFTVGRSALLHLAQILVLSDGTENCASNITHLNRVLRTHKIRLDRAATLPALGILVSRHKDADALAGEINDVYEYLRSQKGFGGWSIATQELMMQTVAFLSTNELIKTTASTAVANLIIAQQVAMMVAIMAASTAAAAAAASG